jgi:hypothetical protein
METLKNAIDTVYAIANIPIELFDYTISLWNVILFVLFGGLIAWFFRGLMK